MLRECCALEQAQGFLHDFIGVEKTSAVELGLNELFEIGGRVICVMVFRLLKDDEPNPTIAIAVKGVP